LAFIFWFYEEKRFKLFWILLLVFVGLQENFFVLAAALGLFITVKYRDYKRGLPIFLGGLTAAVFLLFYFIPSFTGGVYYYTPKHFSDLNILSILRMLYSPSSKIDVVVFSFLSFGFLPLLSPVFIILLGEEFLGRFLGTTNTNWWILGFHYNAILAPILAFAAVCSVEKYLKNRIYLASLFLVIGTIVSLLRVKPDIYKMFFNNYYDFSKTADAKEVLKYLPEDASVASSNNLGAQIAERDRLFFLTNCIENPAVWGADGKRCYKLKPEYILADLDPNEPNNYYPDYDRDSILRYLNYIQNNGDFKLVKNVGDVYLLKKVK